MGGVDLRDMLIKLYKIEIRGKKMVYASLLLFLGSFSRQRMVALFCQRMVALLADQDCSTPKRPKLVKLKPYDSVHYDSIQHWPEAVADKKRCRLCFAYARIQCSKCQVSLCLVKNRNCFKIFHTQ
ncbi:hypothetical protein QYM36_013152 [Artemia franciscana]|uniref:Uncharacterized protein n=1 Tax=Artemia franciscana TaxID=6661 RepID=A0AA88HLR1_ARTSF|nr:hypothetical protein QYM36_013152 [Artemia franciscana]